MTSRQLTMAEDENPEKELEELEYKEEKRRKQEQKSRKKLEDEVIRLEELEASLVREMDRCFACYRCAPEGADRWYRHWWWFESPAGDSEACVLDEDSYTCILERQFQDLDVENDDLDIKKIVGDDFSLRRRLFIEPTNPGIANLFDPTESSNWLVLSGCKTSEYGGYDSWYYVDNVKQVKSKLCCSTGLTVYLVR